MTSQTPDPAQGETCDVFKHKWSEEYYGYKCQLCGLFIPFGCEPWLDPDDAVEKDELEYVETGDGYDD